MTNITFAVNGLWSGALIGGLLSIGADWSSYFILFVTAVLYYGMGRLHNAK